MDISWGLASSAIGWCGTFLVNWIISRFVNKDKQQSNIFLWLFITALGCHMSALIVFLCFY